MGAGEYHANKWVIVCVRYRHVSESHADYLSVRHAYIVHFYLTLLIFTLPVCDFTSPLAVTDSCIFEDNNKVIFIRLFLNGDGLCFVLLC